MRADTGEDGSAAAEFRPHVRDWPRRARRMHAAVDMKPGYHAKHDLPTDVTPSRELPASLRPGIVGVQQERCHSGGEAAGVFPEQQVAKSGEGHQLGAGDAVG